MAGANSDQDDARTLDEVLGPPLLKHGVPIVTGDLAEDLQLEQQRRDRQGS